jgi:beta-1,4-N-acetylglucosaminyltransferase
MVTRRKSVTTSTVAATATAAGNHLLVSVGTTSFDSLIRALDEDTDRFVAFLTAQGFDRVTLQVGRGTFVPVNLVAVAKQRGVDIDVVAFFKPDDWLALLQSATVVISQAGAGSITEVLRAGKHLLVVVNEALMHNHQVELAKRMADDRFVFWSSPRDAVATLAEADFATLVAYDPVASATLSANFPAALAAATAHVSRFRPVHAWALLPTLAMVAWLMS